MTLRPLAAAAGREVRRQLRGEGPVRRHGDRRGGQDLHRGRRSVRRPQPRRHHPVLLRRPVVEEDAAPAAGTTGPLNNRPLVIR